MKQEILTKLKSAEDDIARRTEKAKERAADVVKQARAKAEEVLRQAQEDARRDQESQVQLERQKLAQEREKVLADGRTKEDRLRSKYKTGVDAAVKKAIDVFSRSLNG